MLTFRGDELEMRATDSGMVFSPHVVAEVVAGGAVVVDDCVRVLHSGAAGYLTKPVAPEELMATVAALLRHSPLKMAS